MSGYSLTDNAKVDIADIWAWISADNPVAAEQLSADILNACKRLSEHPESGSLRPAWTRRPVRFLLVRKNYFIVYLPESKPVVILRVLHAARDIRKALKTDS
jgi:toxin ParE1/3/4